MKYKTVKECDEELNRLYERREVVNNLRDTLAAKETKAKASKKLTKAEAARYKSLVDGKEHKVAVKTYVGKEKANEDLVTLRLMWETGLEASVQAKLGSDLYDLGYLLKSKAIKKYIKQFNDRIEKFDLDMEKKYGTDWPSLVN